MSWGEFKIAPAKQERVKGCNMSKFTTIDAFFVNVNKNSVLATVLEHPLLWWRRLVMLMCLAPVTETLLYCRPPLAHFAVAHA